MADHDRPNDSFLLQRFNQRETGAIVSVYKLFFTELHLFASKLYQQSDTAPEDVVQDVFCSLLTNTEARFESMVKLKAFLYTAVQNKYKNYLKHAKLHQKYQEQMEREEEFEDYITQNEVYAQLHRYVELLPPNCAPVMKLYLAGYEPDEIAKELHLSLRTVYNTKSLSVRLLKEMFSQPEC